MRCRNHKRVSNLTSEVVSVQQSAQGRVSADREEATGTGSKPTTRRRLQRATVIPWIVSLRALCATGCTVRLVDDGGIDESRLEELVVAAENARGKQLLRPI